MVTDRWTWHGGGIDAARDAFGGEDWLDLSTGINPHPWPAERVAIDWSRLPGDRDLATLEAAAADHFGVARRFVCAVPGTEMALRAVGAILGTGHHLTPGYRTHGAMFAGGGTPVGRGGIDRADGGTLVLANPGNPDGRLWNHDQLAELARRRGRDGWLLIDEAYADATPGMSLAFAVGDDARIAVFRSFGKFFGLAGVRLGFVIGPPSLVLPVRERIGAWPVSAAAIAIGTAAYRDGDWIDGMRARLAHEAAALDDVLTAANLPPMGQCPLFRLVEGGALFDRLARRGILTRPFAEDTRPLRIGLPPDTAALRRLAAALADG